MNRQKEQNIASCNEFSLYLEVCVGGKAEMMYCS